jgi:hypothetical protein
MSDELKLDRIEDKIGKIEDHMQKQEVNLARLTVSVEEHVKRSNLLEAKMKPIEDRVNLVDAAFKIVIALSIMATIIGALYQVIGR